MNKQEIIDAYLFLRENNHDIPDDTLDFMKNVALRELEKINDGGCSSCEHDGFQTYFPGPCTGCGAEGELKNFEVKK